MRLSPPPPPIRFLVFAVLLMLSLEFQAQCSVISNTVSPDQTTIPVGCNQFLADFIPHSTDPVLEVNLQIWLFNRSNGTGNWQYNTVTDADNMINSINSNFNSLQAPNLIVSGVSQIQSSKINFVRKGFNVINNTTCYQDGLAARAQHYDPNAINIYFLEASNVSTGIPSPWPNNVFYYNSNSGTPLWHLSLSNLPFNTPEHELGHTLGLDHTWLLPQIVFNGATYSNTDDACCPTLVVNDYHLEYMLDPTNLYDAPDPGDEWAFTSPNCASMTSLHSNNIMGYNTGCRNYLSPLQLAMMQYHLRTHMTHVLTTNSYDNEISRNPNLDYLVQNVNGGEIWTSNRYIKGNITVKSGNKLEIYCKVGMAKGTRITVEKNAQLIIGSGGELTNISCQRWDGVFIQGTGNLAQAVNPTTGYAPNHGVVRVINGGKISNAENGVRNYNTHANGNIDWSSTGGVIIGDGGIFENNTRDVEFIYYHSPNNGHDKSAFTNCEFITTTGGFATYAHVSMWETRGIEFKGCNFEYNYHILPGRGVGILSMDANYYVYEQGTTKSTFVNLNRGISVLNSNPLIQARVKNSVFEGNWVDGTLFKNMNFVYFENNDLMPFERSLSNGLYLHTCKNYVVKLNEFHKQAGATGNIANGLYAYNSQGGAHQIYKNRFYDLSTAVNILDKNSSNSNTFDDGLKINCNDFNQSANAFDVALSHTAGLNPPYVMMEQGNTSTSDPKKVVRNIYGANCTGRENQWYVSNNSTKPIDHGCNSQSFTQPACTDNLVNVAPRQFPLNYPLHCLDYPEAQRSPFLNNSQALDDLNNHLTGLLSINSNNDQYFEIQATLSSKINIFLSDTGYTGGDSIVALIQNYGSYIADSDLQLVFVHMNNGNITQAQSAINNLGPNRADWASLLNFMLELQQDSMSYFRLHLDTNAVNFLKGYAYENGRDGQFIAQAILAFVLGFEFEEPRTYLGETEGEGERRVDVQKVDLRNNESMLGINLYPNPGNGNFTLSFEEEQIGWIQVSDLLGREILHQNIEGKRQIEFTLNGIASGMYIVEVNNVNSRALFKQKLIKQD